MDIIPPPAGAIVPRHRFSTMLWHWVNAVAIFILLGSGLGISNAHPRLYWGMFGANFDHAWANLPDMPAWITIPTTYDLAMSRRWHLFFALVLAFGLLAFMVASLLNRHFQRDLRIATREVAPPHIWADAKAHLAFRFRDPNRPGTYNILQKIAYAMVIFVLLPMMIFSGLTLGPGMDAAWPWLLDVFGGRQSARSIHFICAMLIGGFVVLHLVLVILAGAVNEVRSMITGKWRVPGEDEA
ncbi:cytochrome b/b6 domain-containing protein [Sphingomonas faeni]|uniref:cytochrome b/b6 domain-containing protein n=1 Tax=Sphingomonas faeni TaxID=185950 RepID=UPI002782EF44|nr:cytochrome b/b6 domain-containing protein [Sphingomonas faeni]MDQ0839300.1 Ni/Fe-hydrogenase b-type cytochrome subunit [Sphingomonas faeni]